MLACLAVAVAVNADDLFIEAESCADHTFSEAATFEGLVSGDRILRLWKGEEPPDDGYTARFPFTLATAGRYHVWVAASLPSVTSSFWWRVDDGAWGHISEDTLDQMPAQFGVSQAMAWLELSVVELPAGEHTLTLRVNERRAMLEQAYLLYLDAVLITDRDVAPSGLVTAADVPELKPRPAPRPAVPRAGRPGKPMTMGTSVMGAAQNRLVRSLGFSLSQTDSDHLTVNEVEPGVWDWSAADAGLEACRKAGLNWQYFPHYHWPPEWYRKTDRFIPCTGLRTGRQLACMSLWSPDILPWFDHCYAALAEHFGSGADALAAIYVGVHGDFGETIFPMGFHPGEKERYGPEGTGLADFWCGAEPDRADFRRHARAKYRDLAGLNAAWGTDFASFEVVDYPPAAYGTDADVMSTAQVRRRWLDFIEWYFDGMTRFTMDVCRIARKHLPDTLLVLPLGGGAESLVYGQDNTALPKEAAKLGVHIRSTHGGYLPFAENYATMNRRIATACKHYGAPFWMEPPGSITPEGEVSRIMESVSCASFGFWDWGSNPVGAADVFREYAAFFTREEALALDVALFFPTTDYRLHWNTAYPSRLRALGARLRDVMDYDIVDEMLIADGALAKYRVLIWLEGDFVEAETLAHIEKWVDDGGVLLKLGAEPPQTVEGDLAAGRALLGLTEATALRGQDPVSLTPRAEMFLRHTAAADPRAETVATGLASGVRPLLSTPTADAAWALRHEGRTPLPGLHNGHVIVWAGREDGEAATNTFLELCRDTVYCLGGLEQDATNGLEIAQDWDGVYTTLLVGGEILLLNPSGQERTVRCFREDVVLPPVSLRSVQWPK
jgi:hypothetical protein